MAENGPPDNQDAPQSLSLPVYGNYCGVGHGDPTWKTPPIDAVDLVCRSMTGATASSAASITAVIETLSRSCRAP